MAPYDGGLVHQQKQECGFVFQFIGLLYSGSKGRVLQFKQEDSILCPDPGDLDGQYIDHRTGSILTVIP